MRRDSMCGTPLPVEEKIKKKLLTIIKNLEYTVGDHALYNRVKRWSFPCKDALDRILILRDLLKALDRVEKELK